MCPIATDRRQLSQYAGHACFRDGQYDRAIDILQDNIPTTADESLAWDFVFLSMSQAAVGHRASATTYLNLAKRQYLDHERPLSVDNAEELAALIAEAEAALVNVSGRRALRLSIATTLALVRFQLPATVPRRQSQRDERH